MEKKQIDWENLGFGYVQTEQRYVSNYKDGKWDEGGLTEDAGVVLNECAGVLQYAQTVFEGMKAYTTEDGKIVVFRPDLNAARMADSARRLEMPVFPEERFLEAVKEVVKANAAYVPPYGSGATLYIRPYMFGSNPVIGVKPADEYQFRVFVTPVGPYFKGGVKPLTLCVSDFDRAAPHGTGHIKAGLNYAMRGGGAGRQPAQPGDDGDQHHPPDRRPRSHQRLPLPARRHPAGGQGPQHDQLGDQAPLSHHRQDEQHHLQPGRARHPPRHRGRLGPRRCRCAQLLLRLHHPQHPRQTDQLGIHRHDRGQSQAPAQERFGSVSCQKQKVFFLLAPGKNFLLFLFFRSRQTRPNTLYWRKRTF